ncbi:MAG TPA: hypothetical protein VLG44_07900 [Chlamydiales bacterium]|nr:hypothetical protein [Chlamydiales bacterium]
MSSPSLFSVYKFCVAKGSEGIAGAIKLAAPKYKEFGKAHPKIKPYTDVAVNVASFAYNHLNTAENNGLASGALGLLNWGVSLFVFGELLPSARTIGLLSFAGACGYISKLKMDEAEALRIEAEEEQLHAEEQADIEQEPSDVDESPRVHHDRRLAYRGSAVRDLHVQTEAETDQLDDSLEMEPTERPASRDSLARTVAATELPPVAIATASAAERPPIVRAPSKLPEQPKKPEDVVSSLVAASVSKAQPKKEAEHAVAAVAASAASVAYSNQDFIADMERLRVIVASRTDLTLTTVLPGGKTVADEMKALAADKFKKLGYTGLKDPKVPADVQNAFGYLSKMQAVLLKKADRATIATPLVKLPAAPAPKAPAAAPVSASLGKTSAAATAQKDKPTAQQQSAASAASVATVRMPQPARLPSAVSLTREVEHLPLSLPPAVSLSGAGADRDKAARENKRSYQQEKPAQPVRAPSLIATAAAQHKAAFKDLGEQQPGKPAAKPSEFFTSASAVRLRTESDAISEDGFLDEAAQPTGFDADGDFDLDSLQTSARDHLEQTEAEDAVYGADGHRLTAERKGRDDADAFLEEVTFTEEPVKRKKILGLW